MNREILNIIQLINSDKVIPPQWLRRNHLQYPLVCNVNNAICLYLSNSLYDFFLDRIKKELMKVDIDNEYIKLVNQLIILLEKVALHWDSDLTSR